MWLQASLSSPQATNPLQAYFYSLDGEMCVITSTLCVAWIWYCIWFGQELHLLLHVLLLVLPQVAWCLQKLVHKGCYPVFLWLSPVNIVQTFMSPDLMQGIGLILSIALSSFNSTHSATTTSTSQSPQHLIPPTPSLYLSFAAILKNPKTLSFLFILLPIVWVALLQTTAYPAAYLFLGGLPLSPLNYWATFPVFTIPFPNF